MNVTVCVKQIPDPAMPGELDSSTNTLKRVGKLILDESDSYGVEMALQLVAAAGEGEVSLVSMAPNDEVAPSATRPRLPRRINHRPVRRIGRVRCGAIVTMTAVAKASRGDGYVDCGWTERSD